MKFKKICIKVLQNIGFRFFAVLSFVLLFVAQRLHCLSIKALELRDVTEGFSMSSVGFGNLAKFFDYFAVPMSYYALTTVVLAAIILMLGVIALGLSLFPYRRVQAVNSIVSIVGCLCSIAYGIFLTLSVWEWRVDIDISEILAFTPNYFLIWLPTGLFAIGALFAYAYAKLPNYRLADGKFFRALGFALSPKNFMSTFQKDDNTEDTFRSNVPLNQKKYATINTPDSLKKANRISARKRRKSKKSEDSLGSDAEAEKVSNLQKAVDNREHAELIANKAADDENRAMRKKRKPKKAKKTLSSKKIPAKNQEPADSRARALEIAKLKAKHAEEVAAKDREIS